MECLKAGYYDHNEANIFGTGWRQKQEGISLVKADDAKEVSETLRNLNLAEFLARSGTTGLQGAAYLIPTKIYSLMDAMSGTVDHVADISMAMVPAEQISGATMNVAIPIDTSYVPRYFSSGGSLAEDEIQTTQATLDFTQPYGLHFNFGNDLIEDSQFDVVEMHVRNAGKKLGQFHMDQALAILHTGTDGDGTQNTEAASNDETLLDDVVNAFQSNADDGFISDRYILLHHQWSHSVGKGGTNQADYASQWHTESISSIAPEAAAIYGMKRVFVLANNITMNPNQDAGLSASVSFVLDSTHAMLSGVKRWLRMENYADPIRDLVGATVTCRTDSVTVYNDASCEITET